MRRTALVTGGSRGIGFETARYLSGQGYAVALTARSADGAARAAHAIGGETAGFACDVTDLAAIERTLEDVYEAFGSIDVLVNNAGILDKSTIETLSEEEWDAVIATNLKGTFFMMQKALPYLEKASHPRIVNVASNAGRMGGYENGLAYTASKGGIIALTYGAARRLAPKGITVNCVAPGTIDSDMSDEYDAEAHARLIARFPVGRFGKPVEVAAAIGYFAGVESDFTTGAVLDVNGGMFTG